MKKLLALILLSVLFLTSCEESNPIESSSCVETVSVTSTDTEKTEITTTVSVTVTEAPTQTTLVAETTNSESITETSTPQETTSVVETTELSLPLYSAYTEKKVYKNNEIVKFTIASNSDTILWLDPNCNFEFYSNNEWIKKYAVKEVLGPGENAIGISKGNSEIFTINLSDYGELYDGKYRIGQIICDEETSTTFQVYSEFQIIS